MTRFGRWTWVAAGLLVAYVAVFSVFVAFPLHPVHITLLDVMSVGAALAAACLSGFAAFKAHDRFMRWYWGLFALANLCSLIAEAMWTVYELGMGIEAPYPSFADVAWLVYYPLAFAALLRLSSTDRAHRLSETISSLDALLITVAGTALGWEFLVAPAFDPEATSLANLTSMAYPLGDLLLLGAVASLMWSAGWRSLPRGTSWVAASLVVTLFADVAYTRMSISGGYETGSWVDPLWIVGYVLFCLGALVYVQGRSRGQRVQIALRSPLAQAVTGVGGFLRQYTPYLAVLVAAFLSCYHFVVHGSAGLSEDVVVVVITTLIPIMVLTRQLLISVENRRLQASLVEASHALEQRVVERTQELATEKERLALLNQAAKEISSCASVEEVLGVGAGLLSRAAHCGLAAVSASGQRGSLRFASTKEVPDTGRRQLRRVLRKFLLSNADNSDATPFVLEGATTLIDRASEAADPTGQFTRIMVFPIISRQVMLGAACLASSDPSCTLQTGESELIDNIIAQLGVALESACRYDDARFLADNDALTRLPNRHSFSDRLDQEVARSERVGSSFALIMMDVDKFKYFNDTYGHVTGDRVLVAVAGALREAVRDCDILGRYGGDEFVAILPGTERAGAQSVVQRIGRSLAEHSVAAQGGAMLSLQMSCGVAIYPADGCQPEELLRAADAHMYEAKRSGGAPPSPAEEPFLVDARH